MERAADRALERCNDARRSSGGAERWACVAAPQRFSSREPLAVEPLFSIGVQDRCPGRVDISHQLSPARVVIGMIPPRQGEIACAEVPLAHGIEIDP